MSHQTLTIEGHTLAYAVHNPDAENPPIIYIHGILNTINMQVLQFSKILAGKRWIALSLPGHYPATLAEGFRTDDLSASFMGRVLSAAVREIGGGQPVRLIGHSTGGFASLTIAYTAPELVEALCLINAFANGRWSSLALRPAQVMANLPVMSRPVFTMYTRFAAGNALMTHIFLDAITHNYRKLRKEPMAAAVFKVLLEQASHLHAGDLYHYFHKMPHTDIRAWLPQIQTPTLILHGDKDPVILPEHARQMDALLPNSTLTWFKNCGHIPFDEAFDALDAALNTWLER